MQRSPEIEQVLRDFISKLAAGDVQGIIDGHSTDEACLVIGTDEHEWAQGRAAIEKIWHEQLAATIQIDDLEAYEDGLIGWFACRLATASDLNMRATGVLRKEDGQWKFIQSHASLARQT